MRKKEFECKRDDLVIRGHEYRKNDGILPAVILCHAYLENQNMCSAYAEELAELGYAAFTFDFNGGSIVSTSSGKSSDMTVLTETADLEAVMKYVSDRTDVDETDLSLLGCSQGGVVCAIEAKRHPEKIKKLMLLYPALCIPDDARAGKMMFAKFDPKNMPEIIQRVPIRLSRKYAECVMEWQLEDIVGGYEGPVLFLQGTGDKVVDLNYPRQAAKYYPNAEYFEIDGGEHIFLGKHDKEARNLIRKFMT